MSATPRLSADLVADRREAVGRLHAAGYSQRAIADTLGVTRDHVRRDLAWLARHGIEHDEVVRVAVKSEPSEPSEPSAATDAVDGALVERARAIERLESLREIALAAALCSPGAVVVALTAMDQLRAMDRVLAIDRDLAKLRGLHRPPPPATDDEVPDVDPIAQLADALGLPRPETGG